MAPKKFKVGYMKIGIDISQIVHEGTGVAKYVRQMVRALVQSDSKNDYILFAASLRRREVFQRFAASLPRRVALITVPIPPTVLDIFWNRLHIVPVEWFTGRLDVFWSSDWTQPPLQQARGVTTIHDVSFLRFPESFAKKIIAVQHRRLARAISECAMFFCDSQSTKKDFMEFYHVEEKRIVVVYSGL